MTTPVDAVLVGAGQRGAEVYGGWVLKNPDRMRIAAVAEPNITRRERTALNHAIPSERQFSDWRDLFSRPRMARAAIIATPDQDHTGPALAALEAGYDVLLEKPIAHRLDECVALVQAAEKHGRALQVCHVMRFIDFFQQVRHIIQSGRLGQIITVSHRENVSAWHMAHSYVRGNWRRLDLASPMILAKCCHDLDMLAWVLDRKVTRLSSFGGLLHFLPENAPPGAPDRCTDGCPAAGTCPFYAPAVYIELRPIIYGISRARDPFYRLAGKIAWHSPALFKGLARIVPALRQLSEYDGWPRSVVSDTPSDIASLWGALRTGPYGRCVYRCDNDVVDHQVMAMEFEGGISASHTMHGHSFEEGRTMRIDGSQATLLGKFSFNETTLEIRDHRSFAAERIVFPNAIERGGHGGGDEGLMQTFTTALQADRYDLLTPPREALESHLMAFAAEQARIEGRVIELAAFRQQAEAQTPV